MTVEALFLISFILLIAEAFIPSLGMLGLGGFIAFVSGIIMMVNAGETHFYGLSLQSVIALGCLFFISFAIFGIYLLKSFRKKISVGLEYMEGEKAEVKSWKKGKGIITFEGEDWRAVSLADTEFQKGDTVIITGYNKMTLTIKKEH